MWHIRDVIAKLTKAEHDLASLLQQWCHSVLAFYKSMINKRGGLLQ